MIKERIYHWLYNRVKKTRLCKYIIDSKNFNDNYLIYEHHFRWVISLSIYYNTNNNRNNDIINEYKNYALNDIDILCHGDYNELNNYDERIDIINRINDMFELTERYKIVTDKLFGIGDNDISINNDLYEPIINEFKKVHIMIAKCDSKGLKEYIENL